MPNAESPAVCPICQESQIACGKYYDDRHGFPGRFMLARCAGCGHRSTQVSMTPSEIAALYTNYYPRSAFDIEQWQPARAASPLRTWYRGLKASAFRWVPPRVRVLDIGCGLGESLGYHRARGCDAYGVEADSNIQKVAQRHGLNVRVGLFDPLAYAPGFFDFVTLDQVVEHFSDPVAMLQGVARVLRPGGTLVLSTPNADGWGPRLLGRRSIVWHIPYHLQFFTPRSMALAAARTGFTLVSSATITNAAWLGFQWSHLATFPSEGSKSCYWTPAMRRTAGQRLCIALSAVADRIGLNAGITRLFDACGLGDNFVFVLRKPEN